MQNKTILCVFAMEAMTNTRTQLICSWTIDRWIFHYYLQRCSMEQTEQSLADYERKIYLKKSDVNLVLSVDLYGTRTHEIAFECWRWRVRRMLCGSPYIKCQTHNISDSGGSRGSRKKSGFYFSMHNTATAAIVSDTGYNFNTLSYLLGFESVRKPNETNER